MLFHLSGCPLAASFDSALAKEAVNILSRLLTVIDNYTLKKEPKKKKSKVNVCFRVTPKLMFIQGNAMFYNLSDKLPTPLQAQSSGMIAPPSN
jgi:hypothetical protein